MLYAELTEKVIGCAMKVHRVLGPGFLESVYQNALALELQRAGVTVELERPHEVQPVNYLTVTGIEIGLLLDFGAQSLEYKRKSRSYHRSPAARNPVNPVNPV